MNATMTDLSDLLKRLRTERELTQKQVAEGVVEHGGEAGAAAVSLWEKGGNVTYRNAHALAEFFQAPEILVAAGFDRDEYESLRRQLDQQAETIDELKRIVADLQRRLN